MTKGNPYEITLQSLETPSFFHNNDDETIVLPLSEGREIEVGDDPDRAEIYFSTFINKHYREVMGDEHKLKALQVEALKAMINYYNAIADEACYNATLEILDTLIRFESRKPKTDLTFSKFLNSGSTPKRHSQREKVIYNRDIDYCFSITKDFETKPVEACIGDISEKVKAKLGKENVSTTGVADILCGKQRYTVLKGNPTVDKSWIALLVRRFSIDFSICAPHPSFNNSWEATNQAFLKKYEEPYAVDNFSKASINTPEAQAIDEIIRDTQKTYKLIS